jgi:hypothetical protein
VALVRALRGSIHDEVSVLFNLPNTSSHTMALGSTQPLTEMGVKGGRCATTCVTPHHHLRANCKENVRALTSHFLWASVAGYSNSSPLG